MEKEKNSQQDLGARSHGEAVSRNESVEKLNEIPGRQIMQEPDPLVEIRSAVHSNYAGMIAMLGADNRVYLGREEHYSYQDGQPGDVYQRQALQHCTPEQALAGMLAKHIVSLYDMCFDVGTHYDISTWDEKITDSLNYLFLLKAIVKEGDTD